MENGTAAVDLGPACAGVSALLDGVRDDHLARPTPCPDYTVRELLGHFLGLAEGLGHTARKDLGPATDTPPGSDDTLPELGPGWRALLRDRLGALAEAWRSPDAWQGATRAGGVDLPGGLAGLVALDEVVVHGWDLARATDQAYAPDETSLRGAHAFLAPMAGAGEGERGPFGPVVAVPEAAPLLDRVVGLSGRDPAWRP